MAKSETVKQPRVAKKDLRKKELEEITKFLLIKIKLGELAEKALADMNSDSQATLENTRGFFGGMEMYLEKHIDVAREKSRRFKEHVEMAAILSGKKPEEVIEAALRNVLLHAPMKKLREAGLVAKGGSARKTGGKSAKKGTAKLARKSSAKV